MVDYAAEIHRPIDICRSASMKRPGLGGLDGDESEEDDDEQCGEVAARET